MIQTGIISKVKIQDILSNQLPEFIRDESPLTVDFLKQYYTSQEYQGAPVDLIDNLNQYLNIDNLTPEVIVDSSTTVGITTVGDETITVTSTKGFPNQYGLLKINNEIITYTDSTPNSFVGCQRGFSGITSYHDDLSKEDLVFSTSVSAEHDASSNVQNLSSLFLKEFYKKFKKTFLPGLENTDFQSKLDVGTFIREARSLYQTKGTNESFRILFNILYGITPTILNLEERLIKPSFANFVRRRVCVAELLEGNPRKLQGQSLLKGLTGQTLFRSDLDLDVNASISEIEPFERTDSGLSGITTYYKIGLFIGYDDNADVRSDFVVVPNTKAIEKVEPGSNVITVDSTVGFGTTGTIIVGVNTITYGSKTINQFLDCDGITSEIQPIENVRSNITYFGFEDGDLNKKVVLRLTGVISEFNQQGKIDVSEGEIISIKDIGDKIENPDVDPSYKEIFSNSWIYNTSASYFIIGKNESILTLGSNIDRSSLKTGDFVDIVERGTNNILTKNSSIRIVSITDSNNTVELSSTDFDDNVDLSFTIESEEDKTKFKLRKRLNKPNSSIVPIEYNSNILSDVQNLYTEDDNAYVASNSLPSFNGNNDKYFSQININTKNITADLSDPSNAVLDDRNDDLTFNFIKFGSIPPFTKGDKIFYSFTNGNSIVGLETGSYIVDVFDKKIKFYRSPSGLDNGVSINLSRDENDGIHNFTLFSQRSNEIGSQKLLKKFPLTQNLGDGGNDSTPVGQTGMLINGVEITNYKSDDKIYFGPLTSVDVLNSGEDYDVINPPSITVSTGIGTTALVQPVVTGKVEDIIVDVQTFDIDKIVSIGVTGGNGSGCILEPVIGTRFRKEFFNTDFGVGGGINTTTETITFLEEHNFIDGEQIIYDSNSQEEIKIVGVGTNRLVNGAIYYAKKINNRTIKLFETFESYTDGTPSINFSGNSGFGNQIFKVGLRNSLLDIKIIESGQNYTNRKLFVKPTGISTFNNRIIFNNHGFNDGDLIEYIGDISGLNQSNNYYINKNDENSFSLSNAGVGGTILSNYERGEIVSLESIGSDTHTFKYPDIKAFVEFDTVGVGTTAVVKIEVTPKVKGSIKQLYLYESGTGYGSTIINNNKRPIITLKNGKNASLTPIITNGTISDVSVGSGGKEYFSTPDLEIIDPTGKGIGAVIRPVIVNRKIDNVIVINPGIGYSSSTSIRVKSSGKNALFLPHVRSLSINKNKSSNVEHLEESENKLKYSFIGYSTNTFNDDNTVASGIIGWAYDGNPIYGPFGYENPENPPSNDVGRRILVSGYELQTSNIIDRPNFEDGFFVEDYVFTSNGDLDEHNGRYEVTKEFPNGTYSYHASIDDDKNPKFPYFIGNTYRSKKIDFNFGNDSQINFDFNNTNILRNTLPYKTSDDFANNDFIVETNEIEDQKIEIESISSGSITGFNILNSGSNYKVDEILKFSTELNSSNLISSVSKVKGKLISNLNTDFEIFNDCILTWTDKKINVFTPSNHNFKNNDIINISGLSTDLSLLNGSYKIGVNTFSSNTISTISASPIAGFTTEIFVSNLPSSISVGNDIGIGTETLKILNIYNNLNILTVERSSDAFGTIHPEGTKVNYLSNSFTFDKKVSSFDSSLNKKIFFNPNETVGLGTADGTENTLSFKFAGNDLTRNVPVRQIYLENHRFKTNEKVVLSIPNGNPVIAVSTDTNPSTFNLSNGEILYVVNKTINTIGIKTGIGNNFNEIYFRNINSADNDLYSFETDFNQVKGDVTRVKTNVTTTTSHELQNGDTIDLIVKPNLSVGIGTSSHVRILRDTNTGNLLINPITFSNLGVSSLTNSFNIINHGLKTGQKVKYSSDLLPEGLENQNYYVYKVDDNNIKLSKTLIDSQKIIPNIVGLGSTGGETQTISLINPQIISINNNNLRFDLSDSSVSGYDLNFYYDQNYKNQFKSSGITTTFSVVSIGDTVTIGYGNSLPKKLYYNLEKSGLISTSDTEVKNYSEILFVDSVYNNSYNIDKVNDTSFDIFLNDKPEKLTYLPVECDDLHYNTNSKTATGGIDEIKIISGGSNYKKLPNFLGISGQSNGIDAVILPTSNSIGNIENVRIINEGFEYSSDRTLEPECLIASSVEITNSNTLGIVSVTSGGSDYITAPNIIIVDSNTGLKIDSGVLEPVMLEKSILSVDITELPIGLPQNTVTLRTTDNTNGITILEVKSNAGTSYTCKLATPQGGFSSNPFAVNDRVFIEGVEKISGIGSGFNSKDYGFNLLKVSKFDANVSGFAEVTIDVSEFGTANTGIAKTIVSTFATVINEDDYPTFFVTQNQSIFDENELVRINNKKTNLEIIKSSDSVLKIFGKDLIKVGDIISGQNSGSQAKISKITKNIGRLKTDFSILKNIGWDNSIGKLNEDFQVIPDNDYYQNMSYSIQSSIPWKNLITPVNNLLHTSGTKNFADTGITSTANISIGSSNILGITLDIIDEKRVDELRDIDTVRDSGVTDDNTSRSIVFDNIRLSNFIKCDTNDVLIIDNINQQFSNLEGDPDDFSNIFKFNPNETELFDNILIRTESNSTKVNRIQFSDFILLSNGNNNILLEKSRLINSGIGFTNTRENNFAEFKIVEDGVTQVDFFRFSPTSDPNSDIDYDLKIFSSKFDSLSGVGTTSIGPINLTSSVKNYQVGQTNNIVSVPSDKFESLHALLNVINTNTNEMNLVETYVSHSGNDTFIAQAYINTQDNELSFNQIGIITSKISNNQLMIDFENNLSGDNNIKIKAKVIGIGTTGVANETYRFKSTGQLDNSERTTIYSGLSSSNIGISTVISLNSNLFNAIKSVVEVSIGSSKALHEVLSIHDGVDAYVQQSGSLSVSKDSNTEYDPSSGLGTFSASLKSNIFELEFHPDDTSGISTVVSLNHCFYNELDKVNEPLNLVYGNITESNRIIEYNALEGVRVEKTDFDLKVNSVPIFSKSFNPTDSSMVNLVTGKFTIPNHFFRENEELIYTPKSSFVGVGSTPMQFKNGSVIDVLPSTVFAKAITKESFFISTERSGVAVTFVSIGEGNVHEFTMKKKNEKSIIAIDDVVQSPLIRTNAQHILENNLSSQVGLSTSIINLSGISSISVNNILEVDNELMRVVNVGIATTNGIPVGIAGTYNVVEVERGFVGSANSIHSDGSSAKILLGSYNIVGSKVFFTDPPRGNPSKIKDDGNLNFPRSSFNGRVYLRNNYDSNQIFDDISQDFTGINSTFTLKVGGANTIGIGTTGGSGVLFINGIFQSPSTEFNPSKNFEILESGSGATGVTSVRFSGITSSDNSQFISNNNINFNELPRGGVPISLGSTITGLGYAPLVGAKVKALTDSNGTITDVVGVAFSGAGLGILNATYDNTTGIVTFKTENEHKFKNTNEIVILESPTFNPTLSLTSDRFPVVSVAATNVFGINIGKRSTTHTYVGSGNVYPYFSNLTFGSGYNGLVSIAVTVKDFGYEHRFVSADENGIDKNNGGDITAIDAEYNPTTGILVITSPNHGMSDDDLVLIKTGSIRFTCSRDNFQTVHPYPRSTDPVAGINTAVDVITPDIFSVDVGVNVGSGAEITATAGVGGTSIFQIVSAGSNYKDPEIFVSEPSYSNLPVIGVSRRGIGNTTDTGNNLRVNVIVSASATTGIGSTLFEVSKYEIVNSGYAFKEGDVVEAVGLVTARGMGSLLTKSTLTIDRVFNDKFAMWQFGDFDYIDSIKTLQNGTRTRFPLNFNNELISVETSDKLSENVNIENIFLVTINGIIQEPQKAYTISGGTSINFAEAPAGETEPGRNDADDISILFYRGTGGEDSLIVDAEDVNIKTGDELRVESGTSETGNAVLAQNKRTITGITTSILLETNIYTSQGISETVSRPLTLIKQKNDITVNKVFISKKRGELEPRIIPTAKIIGDISSSDTSIFVDNADLFNYENESPLLVNASITNLNNLNSVNSKATASISSGKVNGITIVTNGSGYTSIPTVKISAPPEIGVGVGTTATATATVSNGEINSIVIDNPGLGYDVAPQVLIESPVQSNTFENIITSNSTNITVSTGIVTGIGTTTLLNKLGLKFTVNKDSTENFNAITVGDPIYIFDTTIGSGLISISNSGTDTDTVGIGTTFVDNVYTVASFTSNSNIGVITCLIKSDTTTTGLNAVGFSTAPVGKYSIGKISGFVRGSAPVSIGVTGLTVNAGLTTFPTLKRTGGNDTFDKTGGLLTPS